MKGKGRCFEPGSVEGIAVFKSSLHNFGVSSEWSGKLKTIMLSRFVEFC